MKKNADHRTELRGGCGAIKPFKLFLADIFLKFFFFLIFLSFFRLFYFLIFQAINFHDLLCFNYLTVSPFPLIYSFSLSLLSTSNCLFFCPIYLLSVSPPSFTYLSVSFFPLVYLFSLSLHLSRSLIKIISHTLFFSPMY